MTQQPLPITTATGFVARHLMKNYMGRPVGALIAGGSGSGKELFTDAVASYIKVEGLSCARLCVDSFYRGEAWMRGKGYDLGNYDDPRVIEHDLLVKRVRELLNQERLLRKEPVQIPIYDFETHTRTGKTESVQPGHILLVEGLFALRPEFNPSRQMYGCFLDAPEKDRYWRRVWRDNRERGRDLASVEKQWPSVEQMYRQFVLPSMASADQVVDNSHGVPAGCDTSLLPPPIN